MGEPERSPARWSDADGRGGELMRALREEPVLSPEAVALARQAATDRAVGSGRRTRVRTRVVFAIACIPMLAAAATLSSSRERERLREVVARIVHGPSSALSAQKRNAADSASGVAATVVAASSDAPTAHGQQTPGMAAEPMMMRSAPAALAQSMKRNVAPKAAPRESAASGPEAGALKAPPPETTRAALEHSDPSTTTPEPLLEEARMLASALNALRAQKLPAVALSTLDELSARHPTGELQAEVFVARVEALLALGRSISALEMLDTLEGTEVQSLPRGEELRVLRGELRGAHGRCESALEDLRASERAASPVVRERAAFGAGICELALNRRADAIHSLQAYLSAFPKGRFADAARNRLAAIAE